jgi:hypothetical protein
MTKAEMLKKSGLTETEFKELVQKFEAFLKSLNPAQRAAVDRWLPTATHIARSLGPSVTVEQLQDAVGGDPSSNASISQRGVGLGAPSNGGSGNGS